MGRHHAGRFVVMFAAVAKGARPTRGGDALKLHRAVMFGEVSNAEASRQTIANIRAGKTGTGFAVITSNRVPRPSSDVQERQRGGARNRADRVWATAMRGSMGRDLRKRWRCWRR